MDLRPAVPDDAEAVSAVRRAVYSYSVMSPATTRHDIEAVVPEQRALRLVAEVDGRVVGWGAAGINTWTSDAGQAWLTVYVHPEHRLRGIGGALVGQLHEHLGEVGAVRVRTFATPAGLDFAKRRGYDGSRLMHYAGLDPRVLPEQPPTPEGIRLVGFDEVEPRQAYTADTIASLDEPGDSPLDAIDYDEWLREIWQGPALDKALSVAAMAGDEMVAFTAVETDGDRAWAGMTGTVPAYRGRGLAKLVKSVALRRAAAAGVTGAFTSNDDENGPMLAVNNWLGYRRVETQTGLLRTL
ncbi:GCN5-related N-acetyltransferase [Kribbella flavida DSM 17836]|uniref:GCN5-related N-acetyltransferase n=1 Tax=Kribbella flavida (strain DSM 17836 / JCM 10339 / NBRC 14399) TaxID=479435 RepID=D2PTJ2_KRIFD|nr:GNAT family N-acetyltransferase [Kribbella flavida]ADB31305.1 GCN5-related N-acetyltransferase [Kribbella flavida DSM 17836]